jgi:hypothetical protein
MQPDQAFMNKYDTLGNFELGKSESRLTMTDTLSWKDKSWVLGVTAGPATKAYDWNKLKSERIINDKVGNIPVVIALSGDRQDFAVFERPSDSALFSIRNDTLITGDDLYDFSGKGLKAADMQLTRLRAYQEFWHSWKYFHPETLQY